MLVAMLNLWAGLCGSDPPKVEKWEELKVVRNPYENGRMDWWWKAYDTPPLYWLWPHPDETYEWRQVLATEWFVGYVVCMYGVLLWKMAMGTPGKR